MPPRSMRQLDVPLRRRQSFDDARAIQCNAIDRLRTLEAPTVGERTGIDWIEAELIEKLAHNVFGLLVIAGERQSPA